MAKGGQRCGERAAQLGGTANKKVRYTFKAAVIARNSPYDVSEYSQSFFKQIQAENPVMLNAKANSEVIVPYNDDSTHPGS